MDIKERLRLLESLPRNKERVRLREEPEAKAANIADVVGGGMVETEAGRCFCVEKELPVNHRHGSEALTAFLQSERSVLPLLANDPDFASPELHRALFIDTETTGLSGGAGTCAFLVGIGYFEGEKFKIVQYFMNDFDEERALIETLTSMVTRFGFVVSYNGKSYDIPLLNSRYIVQGMRSQFRNLPHFDLLHAVRRLWSCVLPDCALTTAESFLLQNTRQDDIPGYLIPPTYFDYLRTKNAEPLRPVFYHNRQDILTMVALAAKAMHLLQSPSLYCKTSEELLRAGKIYETCRMYEKAALLYEEQLTHESAPSRRCELLCRMALNYKKQNLWEKAAETWKTCLDTEMFHPLPYIELAKHYEHRKKNTLEAKRLVDKALNELKILDTFNRRPLWKDYRQDLSYRLQRLKRKLEMHSVLK